MFQEAFQFHKAIFLCYSMWIGPQIIGHVPPPLTRHISQIIVNILSPIVTRILN